MTSLNLVSLAGCLAIGFIAWAIGGFRRPVPWRTVVGSGSLMLTLGAIVFLVPLSRNLLVLANNAILGALASSTEGAVFLFGPLALSPGSSTPGGEPSIGFVLAAQVLPAVIFFAALMAILHYLRVIEPIVRFFGRIFHKTLKLSGAEALAGAIHIFFGVETATAVRPYLARMTQSELLTVLTCNLATVASTTLAIYVIFLRDAFPQIAGHLLSASVISIPAAVLVSKLMLPETETPETLGKVPQVAKEVKHANAMAALTSGAQDGLKVAAGITVVLIAVLGVVGLLDLILGKLSTPFAASLGGPLELSRILGWLFTPFAWLLGIESADLATAGRLLGQRLVLTEVVSYQELGVLSAAGQLSPRTLLILSYALCGFAHVAGMSIAVGGFSALAPERVGDLTRVSLRALAAATLASLATGSVAGFFYHGQSGLLGL